MDTSENNIIVDEEYDSDLEEAEYLKEILRNKRNMENINNIDDIDNIDDILIKSKNKPQVKSTNNKIKKNVNIISDIFKNNQNTNTTNHKYYFKPKLPPIYKNN
jgi:hypothetical protein